MASAFAKAASVAFAKAGPTSSTPRSSGGACASGKSGTWREMGVERAGAGRRRRRRESSSGSRAKRGSRGGGCMVFVMGEGGEGFAGRVEGVVEGRGRLKC